MVLSQEKPLVSICIPTYNCAKFLKDCLDSIVNQTYPNKEIIVCDNASTDNTEEIIKEYIEKHNIRYYRNARNIGAEANFSKCIQLAIGEYIAIFHSDDLYMVNMVQKQVQAFESNPSIGAVFAGANVINSHGKIIGESKLPIKLRNKRSYYFPEIFLSIMSNLNFLICPSAMVRSKIYKELASFDGDRFGTSADLDMWFRILERYPIAILNEKLMNYRTSDTHGSFQLRYLRTEQADFFKVMDYYLSIKVGNMDIPKNVLNEYEFLRSIDKIRCAVNYLIQDKLQDAKELLKKSFSVDIFWGAIGSIKKPKFLCYWGLSVILLSLIYLGLGGYLGKYLDWLLYQEVRLRE